MDMLISGAEINLLETIEEFESFFSKFGLTHQSVLACYGMAEHTLFIAGDSNIPERSPSKHGGDRSIARVCCGVLESAMGVELKIVNPETREEVADGTKGEIWVRSGSLGFGLGS